MTRTEAAGSTHPSAAAEWYACYTRGRHEKRVAERLRERGVEVFLPLVPTTRRWHDREAVVEFPLFPSYVFARCAPGDLSDTITTPGVVSIVRFNDRPVAIPTWEIESIRRLVSSFAEGGLDPEPAPTLSKGELVDVIAGPLEGVRGTVVERRGGKRIVLVVGVTAIAQGLRVEVERDAVRPAGNGDAYLPAGASA